MIAKTIELGNSAGKLGAITSLFEVPQIHSINPNIFDENVMNSIKKDILTIASDETPSFVKNYA